MPTVITQCDICHKGFKTRGSATRCENKHKKEAADREELVQLQHYVRLNSDGVESLKENLQYVLDKHSPKQGINIESVTLKYIGKQEVTGTDSHRPVGAARNFKQEVDKFEVNVKYSERKMGFCYPGNWGVGLNYWGSYHPYGAKFFIFAPDFPKLAARLEAMIEAKRNKNLGRQILISNAQAKMAEDDVALHYSHRVKDALSELKQAQEYYSSCEADKTAYINDTYRNPLAAALASSIRTLVPEANAIGFDLDIPRFSSTSGLT